MSTPFPTEEAAQTQQFEPTFDLSEAKPQTHWYSGMGFNEDTAYMGPLYRLAEAGGSGAAKGMAVLNGLWGKEYGLLSYVPGLKDFSQKMVKETGEAQQDFRGMVQQMTPDPTTTGGAVRVLHSVGEGGYLMAVGALTGAPLGGALAVGTGEGGSRYQELREQGVDRGTAAASGALAGVSSAAGAVMPAAYGESLLANMATGTASNTAFGVADRFLDHKILEAGGYPEMAEQQKALDGTQMLIDAALGATFGVIHHATAANPEKQDAALTANLALRDRQSAPGVATDPQAANAHQSALEQAQADLMARKPVDVSDSGVGRSTFLSRPERDLTPEREIILKSFKESGLLDEEANLRDLEAQFAQRIGQPVLERESVKPAPAEEPEGYHVQEGALTDEQRQAFQGLRSDVQTDQDVGGRGAGIPAGSRGEDDGGTREAAGEPLTVYRGGRGGPLTPEHFEPESLGKASGHPSSGLGVFFTGDAGDAARYGTVTAHHLDIRNPKVLGPGELPAFDSIEDAAKFREQIKAEGHDGITLDYSSVGGPVQHVAFEHNQVIPASPEAPETVHGDPVHQALTERPDLKITDEHGQPTDAAAALEGAKPETDWFTAVKAAADCFGRRGG